VAFASCILCNVLQLRRDFLACEALANELIEYCKEQRFAFWLAAFQIHHGVAQANLLGDRNGAIEAETGISNWMKTGAIIHVPTWSSLLAEAALASGEVLLAEKTLATGIEMAIRNGEVFALAELQRLTGHLLLGQNRREEAHRSLSDGVITARQQGANLYLLRAARDRARMLAQDGDRLGARALLQPIVDEYPEHRDGSDFQEAAELLSGLQ
jgi:predicted ATPase